MHFRCFQYGSVLPLSPVRSIIQQAHYKASIEDRSTPLPPLGLVYIGPVVEPLGHLLLEVVDRPLLTYGQWEQTLLALRIFVDTWETVEFWFDVGVDTAMGYVSTVGLGRLVAVDDPPMPRPPSGRE